MASSEKWRTMSAGNIGTLSWPFRCPAGTNITERWYALSERP